MRKWLCRLLRCQETEAANERVLTCEREVQSLRLELEERDQAVARHKGELERQRSNTEARVTEAARAQMERLLADAATPVAQLRTQSHLLEVDGKPVQARDVLAVSKRLLRVLEDHGLTLQGNVGESAAFDPAQHEPLSTASSLTPGQPVVVRFVGVAYRGQLLRKASVEPMEG